MIQTDDEKRFDVASLTLRMVALVEQFLDGRTTREKLCSWAHNVQKTHGRSVHNGVADDALHTCLWNLDETLPHTSEHLVRHEDLIEPFNRMTNVAESHHVLPERKTSAAKSSQ